MLSQLFIKYKFIIHSLNSIKMIPIILIIILTINSVQSQGCVSNLLNSNPDTGLRSDALLKKYNYPVQTINVTTNDGYILTVFRIPFSPKNPLVEGQRKKAVYLNHGLGSNSFEWLVIANGRNIAMTLSDGGYDVFLSNARGTSYSQGHLNLTTNDIKYWDFSWHEMGKYDVPAVIDMILNTTGNEKTYYIGHSMGGTEYYVALSENNYLNEKISAAFLMAPAAFIGHSTNIVRLLAPLAYNSQYLSFALNGQINTAQNIQKYTGLPLGTLCNPIVLSCGLCANLLFLLFGFDVQQTNFTQLPLALSAFPDTISTKSAVHFAQSITDNDFRQFNYMTGNMNEDKYGESNPPSYNMSASSIPTFIYYGANDNLVQPIDAIRTGNSMADGVLINIEQVPWPQFTHMDFAFANNATEWLFLPILRVLDSF